MSLLRLLTAGKSLVGLKDSSNRYRPVAKRSLPVFPSKSNPFRTTAKPEPVTGPAPNQAAAAAEPKPSEAARNETVSLKARLSALLRSKPRLEGPRKAPVQAELSLDEVRVVRNDLSDADLEVVVGGARKDPGKPVRPWTRIAERITQSAK